MPLHFDKAPIKRATIDTQVQPPESNEAADLKKRLMKCYQALAELSHFEADWDAEGAPAINAKCIQSAERFLSKLANSIALFTNVDMLPNVFPTYEGGVQLYWGNPTYQKTLDFYPNQKTLRYVYSVRGYTKEQGTLSFEEALSKILEVPVLQDVQR